MTIPEPRTTNETDIRELVERFVAAIRARDVDGVMSPFAPDVVSFDLAASLQHRGGAEFVERWRELFASYVGAIDYEVRGLTICARGDVAFSHSLNRLGGTLRNGARVDQWLRWTACYRKRSGRWLIVHEHVSVPLDLRSGRALLNLVP